MESHRKDADHPHFFSSENLASDSCLFQTIQSVKTGTRMTARMLRATWAAYGPVFAKKKILSLVFILFPDNGRIVQKRFSQ